LPDEAKEEVNKLIAESRELKAKEDVTKDEIDKEVERIQKEFQDLYQKFQAETQNTGWNPDIEIEDKNKESKDDKPEDVIDAD